MDLGAVVGAVTVPVLIVGGIAWVSLRSSIEQATRDQTSEIIRQLNWPKELARQLEQTRGTERQELRFESYGKLWAEMRPLAIYDDTRINGRTVDEMLKKLSGWYFSATGGLMLTSHNRELYFALQDLFRTVAAKTDWEAERTPQPRRVFEGVLERARSDTTDPSREEALGAAKELIEHLDAVDVRHWPDAETEAKVRRWRSKAVPEMETLWAELDNCERFAVLQQVSSVLRTGLSYDVESRLR